MYLLAISIYILGVFVARHLNRIENKIRKRYFKSWQFWLLSWVAAIIITFSIIVYYLINKSFHIHFFEWFIGENWETKE